MKYLITESKLNSAIYEYIDQLFHEGKKIEMVKHFEKEVKNKIYSDSKGVKTVNSAIMIINEVPYVKFEMIDAK